ncbi:transposase [Paenibacillus algicola]|uniref:Transposase n=1 Tax=Paenibacillus algicola TaxID=2565926 RepID=A0A4P8XFX9_9BACL|nr:transposase [Paenibacillus algicola]
MQLTDRETLESIRENPYMQYFIGLPGFAMKQPFHHSMMTHFRKRLTEVLAELNELVASTGAKETKDDDDSNDASGGGQGKVKRSKKEVPAVQAEQQTMFVEASDESSKAGPPQTAAMPESPEATTSVSEAHLVSTVSEATALQNQGTILVDATCAPADVAYPTDLNLLNEAREKLEAIIGAQVDDFLLGVGDCLVPVCRCLCRTRIPGADRPGVYSGSYGCAAADCLYVDGGVWRNRAVARYEPECRHCYSRIS